MSIYFLYSHIHPYFSQRLKCSSHFSCFHLLYCLLIDSFCHSSQINDSSPPLLGPRHCLFHFSTPIPPRCFLSCSTRWTKNFPSFISFHFLPYYYVFTSTCVALYPFCSSALHFSVSPVPCFLTASAPYVVQLHLSQEPLFLIFLSLCPLIITSPTLYKHYHFSGCCPPLHIHCHSSWRQPPCPAMLLHLLPHLLRWCHFLLFSLFHIWTLPLLVSLLSTPKTLHHFFNFLLSPHLLYSTLHYSAP